MQDQSGSGGQQSRRRTEEAAAGAKEAGDVPQGEAGALLLRRGIAQPIRQSRTSWRAGGSARAGLAVGLAGGAPSQRSSGTRTGSSPAARRSIEACVTLRTPHAGYCAFRRQQNSPPPSRQEKKKVARRTTSKGPYSPMPSGYGWSSRTAKQSPTKSFACGEESYCTGGSSVTR